MPKRTATLNISASALGKRILDQLKALLGGEWDGLTAEYRQLLTDIAQDAAAVAISRLRGKDTSADERQIAAQLANIEDAVAERVRRVFWQAVDDVLGAALEFAKAAL